MDYKMSEWISVKDRLPEVDESVLVISSLGIRMLSLRTVEGELYWMENNGFSMKPETLKATHWMPLPEPPHE